MNWEFDFPPQSPHLAGIGHVTGSNPVRGDQPGFQDGMKIGDFAGP